MDLGIIIAGASILSFLVYFFYKGGKRRHYLTGIIYFFPFLGSRVTPFAFGALSVFDLLTYLALFFFFRDFIFYGRRNRIFIFLVFAFIVLLFTGSLASEFPMPSFFGVFSVIPPFIFGRLLLKELKEDPKFLTILINGIKTSVYIAALFIVAQMTIGLSFTFYPMLNQNVLNNGNIRYPGFFMDSQINGAYLTMASYVFLLNPENPKSPKFSNYLYFGLATLLVILAGSRSALIGHAAGIVVLIIFIGGNFRTATIAFGLLFGAMLLTFSNSITVFKRFDNIDDSYSFRASIWEGAYDIFKKHPTLGIGMNNYRSFVKLHSQDQFLLLDNDEIMYLDFPENGYLKVLTEYGIYASLLLLLIIISPIVSLIDKYLKGKNVAMGFFFLAPVTSWFLSFISFYNLGDSRMVILLVTYTVLILAIASQRNIRNV